MRSIAIFIFLSFNNFSIVSQIIINKYAPVISFDKCTNALMVRDASAFKIGDTVMIIQMKGAKIDSSDSERFGTIVDYKNAGNYELNYVKSIKNNSIELKDNLVNKYDLPMGKVQLIRVPYYENLIVKDELSCLPWNGEIGGVLAFNVRGSLRLNNNIKVNGKGFKGGVVKNSNLAVTNCFRNNYFFPIGTFLAAGKGESCVEVSDGKRAGKGCLAAGGGGGLDHNSGGGGGGNGGSGGFGGYQLKECGNGPFDNRGIGGINLNYASNLNKIFLGSGGGAGHCNNGFVDLSIKADFNGGNGGGIVVFSADTIINNGYSIEAAGDSAFEINLNTGYTHDGMGGGGSGGLVLLNSKNIIGDLNIDCHGGKGGDMHSTLLGGRIGPGGGGGGGMVMINQNALPGNSKVRISGGKNGIILEDGDPWGAEPGKPGLILFNMNILKSIPSFVKNIDSLRFDTLKISCTELEFKGKVNTHKDLVLNWDWSFGDGEKDNKQNTKHTYHTIGNKVVKLTITDSEGCIDSLTRNILLSTFFTSITPDTLVCHNKSVQLQASGGTSYQWFPTVNLNNPNIPNPIVSPTKDSKYFVAITNSTSGCTHLDSVFVKVREIPDYKLELSKSSLCQNDTLQFIAKGGDRYVWSPGKLLNDSTIFNPITRLKDNTNFTVKIISSFCGDTGLISKNIVVLPLPVIHVSKSSDINCSIPSIKLKASGGVKYSWSPKTGLDNPDMEEPTLTIDKSATYTVHVTDASGCLNSSKINVEVTRTGDGLFYVPNLFTPNGDGVNDCFNIGFSSKSNLKALSIFNRWGDQLFYTNDPTVCWDGKFKEIDQPSGVYVYQIMVSSFCGDFLKKGSITLIR